ncbi:hypothetical protein GCM10009738_87790 [Kitasatospora viridis]
MAIAAAGLLAATAVTAGAAPAYAAGQSASPAIAIPMTGNNCGQAGGALNCMYVQGSGLYASEVRGWAQVAGVQAGFAVHEEVTGPNGHICNSNTVTSGTNQVVGCQIYPNANIAAGQYCAKLWEYLGNDYYELVDQECLQVFS